MADDYRLLAAFSTLFSGSIYRHRVSTNGDRVALELFEDLYARSSERSRDAKFVTRADRGDRVVNTKNQSFGIKARRGDGVFGEIMHGVSPLVVPDFAVKRGPTVATEVGVEVKILAVAMIKQIDRVIGDLIKQVNEFKTATGSRPPITVGIVGINYAPQYCAYEGDRKTLTNGKNYRHPLQEAAVAKSRIMDAVKGHYEHLLVLEYEATNLDPYPFEWLGGKKTQDTYNAELSRMAGEYEARF